MKALALLSIIAIIESGLGVSVFHLMLIFTAFVGIILTAVDVRISALMVFFLVAIQFAIVYAQGQDHTLHLLALLVSLVFLAVSLFSGLKQKVSIV